MRTTILLLAGLLVAPVVVVGADFDVVSITSPPDTVRQTTTWTPAATVHAASGNPDTAIVPVQMRIGLTYAKVAYPRLGPGQTLTVGFGTPWSADSAGSVAVRCSLLIPDANPANNLVTKTTVVLARKVDVAVQSVPTPTQARIGDSLVPTATVHADDSNPKPMTVTARMRIGASYQDTASQMLAPGQTGGYAFKPWSPDTLGTFRVRCSLLVQDSTPANDTLGKDITVLARLVDFAPTAIATTPPIIHVNDTVVPTVAVHANAYNPTTETISVRLQIGTRYTDTAAVVLDPGDSTALAFGAWLADSAGTFQAYCSLLVQDSTPVNDTLGAQIVVYPPGSDFAVVSIASPPDTVPVDSVVTPAALVHASEGNQSESVSVRMRIGTAYDDTTIAAIAPGQTQQVAFSAWQAQSTGLQTARCSLLTPDNDSTNNVLSKQVHVYQPSQPGGPPAVQWAKSYAGAGSADGLWVEQTRDSGFIVAGWSASDTLMKDCFLLKTDNFGDVEWQRCIGLAHGEDGLNCVRQTLDGGYIVAGFAGPDYGRQPYAAKTDSLGFIQWERVLECDAFSEAYQAEQTSDGGYVVSVLWTGFADSAGVHVFKLDSMGNTQWRTVLPNGGQVCASGVPVLQTSDGGYLVGASRRQDVDMTLWIVRLNPDGDTLWSNTYPTQHLGGAISVCSTSDSGYAVTGGGAMDGDPDDPGAMYLAKIGAGGALQWKGTYGGLNTDIGFSVQQTRDGGYVIAGAWSEPDSSYNASIVKTNATGAVAWLKTFGSVHSDAAACVRQTLDGGYIVAGGGVADPDAGSSQLLLVKLEADDLNR